MRHKFRPSIGALVIAMVGVGGCGGAPVGTTPRSVTVKRGDAICRRFYDRALVAGEGITARRADVVYYRRILPLLRAEIAQLAALRNPDEGAAAFHSFLAADRRIVEDLTAYTQARSRGQLDAALRRDLHDEVAFHAAAKEFGFKVCSSED